MKVSFTYRSKFKQYRSAESGWIIILFLLAISILMIVVAANEAESAAGQIKHDNEAELFRRGHQYERALQLYYRKFQRYPTSLDQLENTNNLRFLRRRYREVY